MQFNRYIDNGEQKCIYIDFPDAHVGLWITINRYSIFQE
jgi:hypothetical protein